MAKKAKHKHQPRFTFGRYPVAAICKTCSMQMLANGGGWVTAAEADAAQRRVGVRGAL